MATPLIALTGGMGSGKSTVASLLRMLGIPVIDFDSICHSLLANSAEIKNKVVAEFGQQVLDADMQISRPRLGQIVFAEPVRRKTLESILHPPAVKIEAQLRAILTASPYIVSEIPLLRSSGNTGRYRRVVLVNCEQELRLRRLQQRDGQQPERFRAVIAAQPPQSDLLPLADDVIDNDGDMSSLSQQVARLHESCRLMHNEPG